MASNKLEVSELDFDAIKLNLKTFLQNQSEFQDYDFEGSGFAILLDLLAYNTHYLGFNANMLANEMYLDSADIRKNIVSLAKMLGYRPTSAKAPTANIDITINNGSGATVTMAKGTVFTTTVDGTSYQFVTNAETTISPLEGVYKFSSVPIFEGTLTTFKYTVDSSDPDQKFLIPNVNADTTTYSDGLTGQVANGNGYTTGGNTLTKVAPTSSGTTAFIDFSDTTWTSSTFTARGALIYNSSASNKTIAVLDFGSDKTTSNSTFTVTFPAGDSTNAIVRIE